MKVGFTGTRRGMSWQQINTLGFVLDLLSSAAVGEAGAVNEFHDGDEAHADREAAGLSKAHGFVRVPHPPKFKAGANKQTVAAAMLARNEDIVRAVDILIAAPLRDEEELRSGTWTTVRRARVKGIPIVMLPRGDR